MRSPITWLIRKFQKAQMCSIREFRQGLYFRLNVASIQLPPLRERKEDIPLLIECFVEKLSVRFGRGIERFST